MIRLIPDDWIIIVMSMTSRLNFLFQKSAATDGLACSYDVEIPSEKCHSLVGRASTPNANQLTMRQTNYDDRQIRGPSSWASDASCFLYLSNPKTMLYPGILASVLRRPCRELLQPLCKGVSQQECVEIEFPMQI